MEETPQPKKQGKIVSALIRRPVKFLAVGVFGENHTLVHRIIVGTGVMVVGVNIAHVANMVSVEFIRMSLDGIGYLVHGIGAVPFVDYIKKVSDDWGG